MPLFARNKQIGVQSLILKLVNNNCPELHLSETDARLARRVNLTVVILIVPIRDGHPVFQQAFTAVTKEFSNTGVAVVLDGPQDLPEAILGFRFEGVLTFVRARGKHLSPLGGGFYQLGFQLTEVVPNGEYVELNELLF